MFGHGLKTLSIEQVQLNIGAVDSTVLVVFLVHTVPFFSLCSSFLSGAHFFVPPNENLVPESELQGEL